MQAETRKNARVAAFLNRSALCLLMLPVACLAWALQTYPPHHAYLLTFSLGTWVWTFAGVLFVVSAAFHVDTPDQHIEHDTGFREAHGH
ncbi:hypothetical protein [Paraburkholderia sacchari]|uniref:hypothetical protein n=1 Tax=Paraburkholderia sacchari TaxID=159450 RepID=UPI0005427C21|nr:hypothetical protein [Paraburkholderia sacchari]NLP63185.1 hypothetical protein [Paraburkholderia sacchari]